MTRPKARSTGSAGTRHSESTEPNPAPGIAYSTRQHPIQGFTWSDFSAKPGYDYTFEIVALRGTPASLLPAETVSVDVRTEIPIIAGSRHHVHFNRGAAASQEYTRRFGDKRPEKVGQAAFDWLSRGAAEAIQEFIGRAVGAGWSLRVGAYEFTDGHVLQALKDADNRGVDVQIRYHAKNDSTKTGNEKAIKAFGLSKIAKPRNAKGLALSHNKIVILLKGGIPQAVLTGSTNFSEGGIYGHSNVVHICEDPAIAAEYLWLWDTLAANHDRLVDTPVISARTPIPAPGDWGRHNMCLQPKGRPFCTPVVRETGQGGRRRCVHDVRVRNG